MKLEELRHMDWVVGFLLAFAFAALLIVIYLVADSHLISVKQQREQEYQACVTAEVFTPAQCDWLYGRDDER